MALCNLVDRTSISEEYSPTLKMGAADLSETFFLSTMLRGVTFHKTTILLFTPVITSNFIYRQ
jgi:hypothetical protein